VCIGGGRAAPPEDCGGPEEYMELMDRHLLNWPYDEVLLVADTVRRFLNLKGYCQLGAIQRFAVMPSSA
jgi:hypothetical protein